MAGGQQVTSGQGSVTQSGAVPLVGVALTSAAGTIVADAGNGIAVSGASSTAAIGSTSSAMLVSLRSRKVGGGAASRALIGSPTAMAAGATQAAPLLSAVGSAAATASGQIRPSRTAALTGSAVSMQQGAAIVQGSVASTLSTTITLTSATTQALAPFTIGLPIRQGEVPNGAGVTTNLSNYQAIVTRRWNDGSAKHVVISGRANTSTSPLVVTVTGGNAPGGTPLTSADISAAAPTASVDCGAFGVVNLSSLLASPVRTWYSGPQMVECHYRASVGGGTLLSVWFHVRLYAGGRLWIRAVVENGYLDNGSGSPAPNASRIYVPTITIGGSVVYNNSGVAITHYANTRYMAEGWIGGDPQVTGTHDAAYLRRTKLVPGYGWTSPSAATLNALTQTYTPFSNGGWVTDMGSTGYQPGIGLLPLWDSLYCTSGDARALRSALAQSSHLNSYAIGWRAASQAIVTPSAFPQLSWATLDSTNAGPLRWEEAHHGSAGYLAYMLTGDAWHYETMAFQASMCYLSEGDAGIGTARIVGKQIRGNAWFLRTIGQYCSIARSDDAALSDYRTLLENNYAYYATVALGSAPYVWNGIVYAEDWSWNPGEQASWMHDFWVATNGMLYDSEALASQTNLVTVRDNMYKWVVGRFGREGVPGEYPFISAARYTHKIAVSNNPAPITANYYQTWGAIYTATTGLTNNTSTNTLGSDGQASILTDAPISYWGQAITALSYAVDHAAVGAYQAYRRLTNASNWNLIRDAGFDDTPLWGMAPRNALPTWLASASTLQWVDAPASTVFNTAGVAYTPTPPGQSGVAFIFDGYNGFGVKRQGSVMAFAANGGHYDYSGNEVYTLTLNSDTPTWARLNNPTATANLVTDTDFYLDHRFAATHTYKGTHVIDKLNRVFVIGAGGMLGGSSLGIPTAPGGWYANQSYAGLFNLNTNDWILHNSGNGAPIYPGTGDSTSCAVAKHAYTEEIYYCRGGFGPYADRWYKYSPFTNSWTGLSVNTAQPYSSIAIDPIRGRILQVGYYALNPPVDPVVRDLNGDVVAVTFGGLGASALRIANAAVQYDERADAFLVIYDNGASINILKVDAATYVVSQPTITGTPPAAFANTVRGQARWVPELGGVVCPAGGTYSNCAGNRIKFIRTA